MRRTTGMLFVTAFLALGLSACAPQAEDAAKPPVPSATQTTDAGETDAATPVERADALCEAGPADDDGACIVTGQNVTGDLSFEGYEIVKLIDSAFDGGVTAGGLREIVVTGSKVGGDLSITRTQGVVVKLTEVGGTLDISDAQHATLVKNTVGGDLNCDGVRADGDSNQVTGTTSCTLR
ncbi:MULTISPECIES: hypothetical protein [unclassified Microbacterium]|uniref:hypothetical protein n=1 Tax=unclassified Microbacterium TaxID=2609290 RepID=UPI0012F7A3E2|nr:hypothetical protein [Microbacterium sp. MAH-37]MVQ41272.1 hypothetical protein [Microbacterium sp. MAH-37]